MYTAGAALLLNGIYTLGPDEAGVIERFGKKVLPYSEPESTTSCLGPSSA